MEKIKIDNFISNLYHLDTINQYSLLEQLKLIISFKIEEFNLYLIDKFIEYIDNKTEYYLKCIEFKDNNIKRILEASLESQSDSFERLNFILNIYKLHFIPFVESENKTLKRKRNEI